MPIATGIFLIFFNLNTIYQYELRLIWVFQKGYICALILEKGRYDVRQS